MIVNVAKNKIISLNRSKHHIPDYAINSSSILSVYSHKYLGATFTEDLTWKARIANIINKLSRPLAFHRRHSKTLTRYQLYQAAPHQSYLTSSLEPIENKAVRYLHGNYSSKSNAYQLNAISDLTLLSMPVVIYIVRVSLTASVTTCHDSSSPTAGPRLTYRVTIPPQRSNSYSVTLTDSSCHQLLCQLITKISSLTLKNLNGTKETNWVCWFGAGALVGSLPNKTTTRKKWRTRTSPRVLLRHCHRPNERRNRH